MIRAFVAITLPEQARASLEMLQHMLPLPRRVPPENLHLTLCFLGEQPEDVLEDVHHALAELRSPGFMLTLSGVGAFGGAKPRNVWAGVQPQESLDHLQRKVETAIRWAGVSLEARRFTPHVTLGRFRPHEVDLLRLEHAMVACADFRAPPFEVTRFSLMHSHLGRAGARYTALHDYALSHHD